MDDRISMLTDELLCHILSFLSTEEAVATSVLSKRWKPLWISVPVLDYDDEIYLINENKHPSCFERFVYATILTRDARQPITKFRLKYGVCGSEFSDADVRRSNADVNVWVDTAFRRGVENFDIQIFPQNEMIVNLSCCIFTSRTLVVLKLRAVSLNACSSVELPSLKSLDLKYVTFVEPKYLMELLHGCPMLEDFRIRYIDYAHEGSFVKEGFRNLPKLVKADLRFSGMDHTNILLKAISNNVESLYIHQHEAHFLVPEFRHVRYLGFFLVSHNWYSVLLMLKNCPNLQSLKLCVNNSAPDADVLSFADLVVPECLTSGFTKCYLKYYPCAEGDLLFAKYILQKSTSLQSMRIRSVAGNDPVTLLEMIREFNVCPRRSASCELSFT